MTYRIRVEHVSRYHYANAVLQSLNEVRITPLTTPWQLVLESRVDVEPATTLQAYVDYWGSVVYAFDLQAPHEEMVVTGRSVVETSALTYDGPALTWAELRTDRTADAFAEFLAPTVQVPFDDRLAAVAADLLDHRSPDEVAGAAVEWVRGELTYVPGTTGVHTSAVEAWEVHSGVCQDFAHLTLAILRNLGIPARYCSGYMHPDGDADIGQTVVGESHAWIEYWTGDWHAVDPTAGRPIDEHHVLVARGRDYSDVPPIKGIFHGGPTAELDVSVSLTRLA